VFVNLALTLHALRVKSSAVWDQVRNFVITPDRTLDRAVRQALVRLGIPENTVFTEQIPTKLGDTNLNIGLGEKSDDFMSVIRYAMPEDANRADSWRDDLPLVVLCIRDTRPPRRLQPYPWITFETLTAGSHCYSVEDQLPDCTGPADMSCAMLGADGRGEVLFTRIDPSCII